MAAAISVLLVISISLLVTRTAAVALMLTGLSRESARFQARSALTGVGFTTSEAEAVLNHPVRRRIIMTLMLLGSAGLVSVVATVVISFTGVRGTADSLARLGVLFGGIALIYGLARSRLFDRWMSRAIERMLKRFTTLDVRDYARLLRITGEWNVAELLVGEDNWLAHRRLEELDLPHEGILVLGIVRKNGHYVGAPKGSAPLVPGDTVVVYGRDDTIADLDARQTGPRGEAARSASRSEYEQEVAEQQREEAEAGIT